MGIVLIKKATGVVVDCAKTAKEQNIDLKELFAKAKTDMDKTEKKLLKTLSYHTTHLYIVTVDEQDKERKVVATGSYTDNAVFLNIDANSYIAIVNDMNGGCFVRSYTRCSEESSQYYWKGERTAKCQNINKTDAENLICGMSFEQLSAKVRGCKGFKVATSKRLIEIEQLAMSKARATAKARAKAEARTQPTKSEERITA